MLNKKRPTIKFTAEWSKTQINFLDVTVYLEKGKIKTDLHVKPTDTHQYLHSSSLYLHSSAFLIIEKREFRIVKRSALIGFAQTLDLDMRCNDLERWLVERSYKEKEVRKQALRGRAICSDDHLNSE